MEKVLIITRAFPPSQKTAAARIKSFAKYLHDSGYYPVVITRDWDEAGADKDETSPSGTTVRSEKHDTHEVYFVPFPGQLSRRTVNSGTKWNRLKEIYLPFSNDVDPYFSLYIHARKVLAEEKGIRKLIISVPPFGMLRYGMLLHRDFGVKWIADYRDEWNSAGSVHHAQQLSGGIAKLAYRLFLARDKMRKKELRWIDSVSVITTVSPQAVSALQAHTAKRVELVINGFDPEDFTDVRPSKSSVFTICYAGWLYPTQQIEMLISAVKELLSKHNEMKLKLLFVGGNSFPGMKERLFELMKGQENTLELTERVTRSESIKMQMASHLLLLSAHKGQNGIPSSKLYEYLAVGCPVIAVPGDHGVIDSVLAEERRGSSFYKQSDLVDYLKECYDRFQAGQWKEDYKTNLNVDKYSRESQVKVLAKVLRSI